MERQKCTYVNYIYNPFYHTRHVIEQQNIEKTSGIKEEDEDDTDDTGDNID